MTSSFLRDLFAGLVYPGALSVALLVLGVGRILGGPASGGRAISGLVGGVLGKGPVAYAAAAICVLLALARLPWPNFPWQAPAVAQPWLLWALIEASAVATALPGLTSPAPGLSRVAVREAQLGASGRLPIWIGMGVVLGAQSGADLPSAAPTLTMLGVLLVLPAAAGWAPFGYDPFGRDSPAGHDATLTDEGVALAQWTRRLQSIFWLALIATVFVPLPRLGAWVELPIRLGIVVALASITRGLRGLVVHRTLPVALRWCWWIGLPCAIVAVILAVGSRQ